jgi:patatin-like phospholipase/acyl hydrolase
LSIDGGGMRGYISTNFMELFVQQWGINPNQIWKYFDVITGSSIGGIQALAYSIGLAPSEINSFFTVDGPWIFTTSTSTPSSTPSTLTKINTIVGGPLSNPTFYPSTTAGIGTMRLNTKLTSVFGTNTLQNALTNVAITSFEKNDANPDFSQNTNTPIYFSNSNIVPILSGQNNLMVDVAMSTSAAPLYFPPWVIGTDSYIDGGVTQNNPASFGLAIGKALKPTANRFCVLSIGTGLGDVGFPATTTLNKAKKELLELNNNPKVYGEKWNLSNKQVSSLQSTMNNLGILEGANLIMYLIGAMTTGPQEIVAQELNIEAKYTLDNLFNYRMQYYLDPVLDTELDNSTPDILAYYKTSVTQYFNNDIANITNFIAHLSA